MFRSFPPYKKMGVLFPKDLDIKSIQKCLIDRFCEFIPLDDNVASDKIGSAFVTFQKDHFIAHVAGRAIKCDYNCRNRVICLLNGYRHRGHFDDEKETVENSFGLDLIDDVVHNNELPHLTFCNEDSGYYECNDNSIMEHFISVDIQKFAEIAKSKLCNHDFFIVYLGRKNCFDSRYMCCNLKTLETYEYTGVIKSGIEKVLFDDVDGCMAKWKAEDEALKSDKPAGRVPEFHLLDFGF
jgi:hypothetical protein